MFKPALTIVLSLTAATAAADARDYDAAFVAHFLPADGVVDASITISQDAGQLRLLDLNTNERYTGFAADGQLEPKGGRLLWSVPREGGTLRYRVRVDSRRNGSFDARMTERWAVLRLDDLFPPARVRSVPRARSQSTLTLSGPHRWSFTTRYGRSYVDVPVVNSKRRFARPTGWMAAGELGVRRDRIAERDVAVAAPTHQKVRRIDILAFLRWTLPALAQVFTEFPDQLLIVSARDAMWRGGLSGPGSLYVHPDRPLISENGTSTLIHELVHVAMATPPAAGDDWIVEGLAEYYAVEILRRTGGISEERFNQALDRLKTWADRDNGRLRDPSTGPHTARAALLFHDLAGELASAGSSLDIVVRQLTQTHSVNRLTLKRVSGEQLGGASTTLSKVP